MFEVFERIAASNAVLDKSGSLLASIQGSRLTLRDVTSHNTLNVYVCIDKIDYFEFSPDSTLILCSMKARSVIQVFSVMDYTWKARIDEGIVGYINCCFAPDSRHIVVESDFGIQIALWSLIDSSSSLIMYPKNISYPSGALVQTITFSDCSQYMAVVHRFELHDHIGLYTVEPWSEIIKIKCVTNDVVAVHFAPNSTHIITVDSPLTYHVAVYQPSGEALCVLSPYANALGVRNLAFHRIPASLLEALYNRSTISTVFASPSESNELSDYGHRLLPLFAIGSYDGKIRMVSTCSWQVTFVFQLVHPKEMEPGQIRHQGNIIVESPGNETNSTGTNLKTIFSRRSVKSLTKSTSSLASSGSHGSTVSSTKGSSHPAMGVQWMGISSNGRYLAAREESAPRCLWIFDLHDGCMVEVIQLMESIVSCRWNVNPNHLPILSICTATTRCYFWCPNRSIFYYDLVTIDAFPVTNVIWSSNGRLERQTNNQWVQEMHFLLIGRETASMAAMVIDSKMESMVEEG